MVQSVELLLDEAAENALREQWDRLSRAGLPSQARHPGSSNRPHVTLLASSRIDVSVEASLAEALAALPMTLTVGPLMCFGRDRFVLVRLVLPSVQLLDLQAQVYQVANGAEHALGTTSQPGRWVPHVTLARRLTSAQVAVALDVFDAAGHATPVARTVEATAVAARRWDGDARRTWLLNS